MGVVALCVEEEAIKNPEFLGLDGENIESLSWLRVYSEAQEARRSLAFSHDVDEVWVMSCRSADPINLAAALKHDIPTRCVYLVAFSQSGSLLSRAHSAGIDGVLGRSELVGRYLSRKQDARNDSETTRDAPAEQNEQIDESRRTSKLRKKRTMTLVEQAETIVAERTDTTGFTGPVLVREAAAPGAGPKHATNEARQSGKGAIVVEPQNARRDGEAKRSEAFALTRKSSETALAKSPAFLLPVVSASGGSGKSAVAAMAALITQQAGLRTMLIDLDLQFGDMKETLGLEEALPVEDLIEAPIRLKHLASDGESPALLTIPRNLEKSEEVVKQLPALLDLIRPNFDMIVVNTGSFWSDEHAVLLEQCSRALFLVDQRPSSLRACQRALDLCTRCGIATSPLIFAVNKCCKNGMYSSIDVSCALHGATSKELMWGGSAVEEYLAAGQAKNLLETRNSFVMSLGALLGEIVPAMPEVDYGKQQSGRPSLLRLFGIE